MWEALAAFLGVVSIVLTYLAKKEKTKVEKAREIIAKNRAKAAREKYNAQIKDTTAMEKDHDNLMAELAAVLSVKKNERKSS